VRHYKPTLSMATWIDDIVNSLTELGGIAHYKDLYKKIEETRTEPLTPSWQATLRRTVETHSSDSENFTGKDLFYSTQGLGKGIWGLRNYSPTIETVDLTEDDIEFPEGKEILKRHVLRERNPRLVFEAKRSFKEKHGKLFCEVCEFVFIDKYGKIGEDFIEAHHIKPISEMTENEKTKISDLVMVCSNCHKMLHRKRPWITKEKLKSLLQ
jgi:putative restriction endonuclease